MDTSLSNSDSNDISNQRGIEIIKTVLDSGLSFELPATGLSMFPTLRPGDRVLVKPIVSTLLPKPGSIIIINQESRLIMHRLTEIRIDPKYGNLFITRGDCLVEPDLPCHTDQITGLAYSYIRNKKQSIIACRILSPKEYRMNRIMLWFWSKMNRLTDI